MQLGAQVALPVREFNMARGTDAFGGVIVYLMLSGGCVCASREPGVMSVAVPVRYIEHPSAGGLHFKEAFALHKSLP